MATSGPTQLTATFTGDADYRTWVQGIHDALIACGMTQTADTGQINPATVLRPAANVVAGYEIWRFNDSLQGSCPVFFKLEYATGTSNDRPSIFIQAGTSSNGAGGLTGQLSGRTQCRSGSVDATVTTRATVAQGDSGQIHLYVNDPGAQVSAFSLGFAIERTKDASGAKTADGFTLMTIDSGGIAVQNIPAAGTIPASTTGSPAFYIPPSTGRSTVALDVIMSMILVPLGKWFYTFIHMMATTDMSPNTVFSANVLGAAHTFRSCKVSTDVLVIPWE